MLAAKVVSQIKHHDLFSDNGKRIGKSSEALEAHHAVLGEQVDTQAKGQK